MGSRRTHSYTVIGDSVNIAARLCGKASPGQILVSHPVLERLGKQLKFETLEKVELKGKSDLVQLFNITDFDATS